jgi:hypothetical protein
VPTTTGSLFLLEQAFFVPFVHIAILILLVLYAIFALIIVRQVDLMSKTLITPVSPVVRGLAIIHAGFAVGFALLAFGLL